MFSRLNKEFLIFLFFLALSGSFWLLMALNETYEKECVVGVRMTDVHLPGKTELLFDSQEG